MAGPLPDPNRRRRNAPTIPTTDLPVMGRKGPAPKVPAAYILDSAGAAWWKWAWKLPQACSWDEGALYAVARRAQLEDDLVALELGGRMEFDLEELLGMDEEKEILRSLKFVIGRLKSMAGGRVGIMKEMRELDNKLGLNPEALAKLRWKIVADEAPGQAARPKISATRRGRLSVVK